MRKLILVSVVFMFALVSPSAAVSVDLDECALPPGSLSVDDFPEDPTLESCNALGRVVELGDMRLEIPKAGTGVRVAVEEANGTSSDFGIMVDPEGSVGFVSDSDPNAVGGADQPEPVVTGPSGAGGPGACSDAAYTDKDEKQYYSWQWYLGDGMRPSGMSTAVVLGRLKDAVDNITASFNDCGYTDQVNASASYQGVASQESQMIVGGGETRCADDGDGRSVVDFGNLDNNGKPPLGIECTWLKTRMFANNVITESDIRFNTTDSAWLNLPATCAGKYDLEAVATHEFGHAFGMGHVSETDHGNLTMSQAINPCDSSARTLGKGDILSLRNTY